MNGQNALWNITIKGGGVKENLCIVVGYEKDEICIILPFTLKNGVLNFITSESTDYNNCYVSKEVNRYVYMEKAIKFLLENVEIKKCFLSNLPSCTELYILLDVLRNNNMVSFLQESVITPSFVNNQDIIFKVQKKQMGNINRRLRRLEKENALNIKHKNYILEDEMDFLIETRNKKYKESIFQKQNIIDFYIKLAEEIKKIYT